MIYTNQEIEKGKKAILILITIYIIFSTSEVLFSLYTEQMEFTYYRLIDLIIIFIASFALYKGIRLALFIVLYPYFIFLISLPLMVLEALHLLGFMGGLEFIIFPTSFIILIYLLLEKKGIIRFVSAFLESKNQNRRKLMNILTNIFIVSIVLIRYYL